MSICRELTQIQSMATSPESQDKCKSTSWRALLPLQCIPYSRVIRRMRLYLHRKRICAYKRAAPNPFVHKSLQNYNDFVWTVTRLNRDMNNS